MGPLEIVGCVAVIAVGVAVIAYILLRTPKKPASFGDVPSIELNEQPEAEDEATESAEESEEENTEKAE
ncbi:MAG: hypothetical protein IJ009_03795 [Clostridia bacterium]|nr:hypothetical protein [Clostridia bacterium]